MGLLDLFRRKPAFTFPPEAQVLDQTALRRQHYEYAHRVLPGVAFDNPSGMMTVLASPKARPLLADLWLRLAEQCERDGQPADRAYRPPEPARRRANATAWYVVTLPQPLHSPEAFLVALAFDAATATVRCFTLELTWDHVARKATTVVCGWSPEGNHLNYGLHGTPPEPAAFLDAVVGLG
jgi:hypothetical protein